MRFLFFALFILIHGCGCVGLAQVPQPNVSKVFEFIDSKDNYVKNPIARLNDKNITCVNATAVQSTSAGNKLKGYASWTIDASAQNGYCEFSLDAIRDPHGSNNIQMEFMGFTKGDGSLYKAQILDGASNVKVQTPVFSNNTDWRPFSAGYPGQASPKVRITQTEAGTAPAIQVGVYYGPATNIGLYTPPTAFTAKVSDAGFVSDQTPYAWINNFSVSSVVQFTASFISGTFTSAPNCVATMLNTGTSGQSQDFRIVTQTSTNLSIISQRASTLGTGFTVSCTKTGADAPQTVIRPETPRTPNIVRYTSGSGTYTPTPGTKYITVELCGGGGGGSGSSTSSANAGAGGNGGATTLGSSLLTASGGGGGAAPGSGSIGGSGGSTTVNSPAVSFKNLNGANGSASSGFTTVTFSAPGGSSPFGGAGGGTFATLAGISAVANSCSGGGGAGGNVASSVASGSGGGAGGYILAKIEFPSAMSYAIGAGGTSGAAGTSGYAGGAGGSGVIIITEHFSNDVNAIIAGNLYVDSVVRAEGPSGQNSTFEGSYTPSWTGLSNTTSLTIPIPWMYLRVLKTLTVWGSYDITPTAANTFTSAIFNLPVASATFQNVSQCSGNTINYGSALERRGVINSVSTTSNVRVAFMTGTYSGGDTQYVSFTCRLQ